MVSNKMIGQKMLFEKKINLFLFIDSKLYNIHVSYFDNFTVVYKVTKETEQENCVKVKHLS